MRFIPRSVSHWHKIYSYQKEFAGASMAGWQNQTAKWLRFYEHYKTEFSKLSRQKERMLKGG